MRERQRETDRQTNRQRQKDRDRETLREKEIITLLSYNTTFIIHHMLHELSVWYTRKKKEKHKTVELNMKRGKSRKKAGKREKMCNTILYKVTHPQTRQRHWVSITHTNKIRTLLVI